MNEIFLKENRFNWLFFCSIFIGIFFISFKMDNDGWFLLNGGRYVLAYGIPHIEPFTIHDNMSFVMQQWLTGVIFWSIYSKFGAAALVFLVYVIFILMVVTLYRLCMLVSNGNFQVSVIFTTLVGILIRFFMVTRPQIFSTLLLLIAVYCMELYIKNKNAKYLIVLPFLSLLLINLHASLWPMLFVIMIPYIIDSCPFRFKFFCGEGYPRKPFFICLVLMVLVGFINPYGLEAMTYLMNSYGYPQINHSINEMKPMVIIDLVGKVGFCTVFFVFFIYFQRKTKLRYLLLSLGTAYMAMSSIRSFFLFLICGMFPIAYMFKDSLPLKGSQGAVTPRVYRLRMFLAILVTISVIVTVYRIREDIIQQLSVLPLGVKVFFALISISLLCWFVYKKRKIRKFNQNIVKNYYLESFIKVLFVFVAGILLMVQLLDYRDAIKAPDSKPAIDYLLEQKQPSEIVLWTSYNTGQYSEFRGIKCYLDARADVFLFKNNKQKDILDEYFLLEGGKLYYKEFIERYAFSHFLVSKNNILYAYLEHDPDYELLFEDENYRLFEKVK